MPRHLIGVDQFSQPQLVKLFELANHIKANPCLYQVPMGTVSTNLFYEPSTRTSSSFYSAMVKLGGSVIPINDVNYSSVSKGESLEDTVKTMACYSEVIVLRHPQQGAARQACEASLVPIINAGDGVGEHPTQALLDLYTITEHFGWNIPIKVALVGDLKHGRTVHSLIKLLEFCHAEIFLISPTGFELPEELADPGYHVVSSIDDCIQEIDVVYMTRVQKERLSLGSHNLDTSPLQYQLTTSHMQRAKSNMLVMHPFPRVGEIEIAIDRDPRAAYFKQIANGLYVRQAIFVNLFAATEPSDMFWNKVV